MAEAVAEPVVKDPSPADPPPKDPAGDPPPSFIETFKAATNIDLGQVYGSDEEAMKGLAHARSKVGQRDEDAIAYQKLAPLIEGKEDALLEFLRNGGQPAPQQPPQPDGTEDLPESYAQLQLWRSQVLDADGNVKPGADQATVQKVVAAERAMPDAALALARDPAGFLAKFLDERDKKLLEQVQAAQEGTSAQSRAETQQGAIIDKNAKALFIDGDQAKGPTAFGEAVTAEWNALTMGDGAMPPGPRALQKAIDYVQAKQPRPKSTRKAPAVRDPALGARPAQTGEDLEKMLRESPDPAKAWADYQREQRAAAAE